MRDSDFLEQIIIDVCLFLMPSLVKDCGREIRKRVELNSVQALLEYLGSVLTSEILLNILPYGSLRIIGIHVLFLLRE